MFCPFLIDCQFLFLLLVRRQKTDHASCSDSTRPRVPPRPTVPLVCVPAAWDVAKRTPESSSGARVWGAPTPGAHVPRVPRLPRRGPGWEGESALSLPDGCCAARCRRGQPSPRRHVSIHLGSCLSTHARISKKTTELHNLNPQTDRDPAERVSVLGATGTLAAR